MTKMIPLVDTEEIVVFGKGVGESILFRVKEDKWIVFDSFIDNSSGNPVAIAYLENRQIDPERIIGIVCTHWDDDHIRGISDIISRHEKPLPVVLPIALKDNRVKQYVYFNSDKDIETTSEFIKVLNLKRLKKCSFYWATADRNLFGQEIDDNGITLKSLSPNDEQYEVFLNSIVLPEAGHVKKGYSSYENSISVAVYAKTHLDSFLFGGDLENSDIGGWEDICKNYHEPAKSHVFKVPHHGSSTAYYEGVWTSIVDRPIAIITRFNRAHLPKEDIIKKIGSRSSRIFVVGPEPKRDRELIKKAEKYGGTMKNVTILGDEYGYVRLYRENCNSDWCVETQGSVREY